MTVPVLVLVAAFVIAPVPFSVPLRAVAPASFGAPGGAAYGSADRLRPQGARVQAWLREARRRSPTVSRLADEIEQSDVMVYLEVGHRLSPNVSACLTWMATVSTRRIVRATFRGDLGTNEVIALLAHELQHVVELIEHPEVRSTETLLDLYRRIGHSTGSDGLHWDTADAVAAGTLARLEATMPVRPGPNTSTKGT